MSRTLALLVLVLAAVPACAPVVTHGPRITPGLSAMGTAGGLASLCDSLTCNTDLVPQAAAGLRYGRAATETRAGFSVGGMLSMNILSSELDLYVQAPRRTASLDAGGGVLLGGSHVMPYLQAGRMRPNGSGWYTTQGFVYMYTRPRDYVLTGGEPSPEGESGDVQPRYWAPTVAYRTAGEGALHLYLSGAFGRAYHVSMPDEDLDRETVGSEPLAAVMLGIAVERRLRAPRPIPPLPPLPRPTPGVPTPR